MTKDNYLNERLSFMRIDKSTQSLLIELKPVVETHLKSVLEEFYVHLGSYPAMMKMFPNNQIIKHASDRQFQHWMTILTGKFDSEYVDSVQKIGLTHARIGLEPRWYIAGYNFIIARILPKIATHVLKSRLKGNAASDKLEKLQSAFISAAMLDIDFAVSVYLDQTQSDDKKAMMLGLSEAFERNVGGVVDALASASVELELTARSMSTIAEQTSSRSISVSAAMEEATTNVSSVAHSADDMGKAISEISKQATHASTIAASAVSTAETTNQTMDDLSRSAEKVGAVVSMIADIAAQTNLLALNATIESARAGEAGKGFAVVASEVKSLATQTAKATEDITTQIQGIQAIAKQSVIAISQIRKTIAEINEVSLAINAAVEEQASSTREIARNTHEAAEGTREVSSHIVNVQQGAAETGAAASQVVSASSELGKQADHLRNEVSKFLLIAFTRARVLNLRRNMRRRFFYAFEAGNNYDN